jgi:hypothetical protein
MRTIKQLVGISPVYYSDKHLGLEIEVEGENLPEYVSDKWRVEQDDSLKTEEAYEYVTVKPHTLYGIKCRIKELRKAYDEKESIIHESVRAGVHVHLNVQEWNIKQVLTFATAYYVIEDVLMQFAGENREGNLFTLRAQDAEYVIFKLVKMLKDRNLNELNTDIIRYASLNYYSLFRYGTLEFRGMRGTGDLDAIYDWVRVIDELSRTAINEFSDPTEVLNSMSGHGELNFIRKLLPTTFGMVIHENANYEQQIRRAARRIQMLAYTTNWADLSRPKINIFDGSGNIA